MSIRFSIASGQSRWAQLNVRLSFPSFIPSHRLRSNTKKRIKVIRIQNGSSIHTHSIPHVSKPFFFEIMWMSELEMISANRIGSFASIYSQHINNNGHTISNANTIRCIPLRFTWKWAEPMVVRHNWHRIQIKFALPMLSMFYFEIFYCISRLFSLSSLSLSLSRSLPLSGYLDRHETLLHQNGMENYSKTTQHTKWKSVQKKDSFIVEHDVHTYNHTICGHHKVALFRIHNRN